MQAAARAVANVFTNECEGGRLILNHRQWRLKQRTRGRSNNRNSFSRRLGHDLCSFRNVLAIKIMDAHLAIIVHPRRQLLLHFGSEILGHKYVFLKMLCTFTGRVTGMTRSEERREGKECRSR